MLCRSVDDFSAALSEVSGSLQLCTAFFISGEEKQTQKLCRLKAQNLDARLDQLPRHRPVYKLKKEFNGKAPSPHPALFCNFKEFDVNTSTQWQVLSCIYCTTAFFKIKLHSWRVSGMQTQKNSTVFKFRQKVELVTTSWVFVRTAGAAGSAWPFVSISCHIPVSSSLCLQPATKRGADGNSVNPGGADESTKTKLFVLFDVFF